MKINAIQRRGRARYGGAATGQFMRDSPQFTIWSVIISRPPPYTADCGACEGNINGGEYLEKGGWN